MDALTLVNTLHLLALCRLAVCLAYRRCPPPLPAGPGGAPRTYSETSLLLIARLWTLWRLSRPRYARLAPLVARLRPGVWLATGHPRIPCPAPQCKRGKQAGALLPKALFILSVLTAIRRRLIGARDLIIDSAPLLAWHRADPDAADLARACSTSPFALTRLSGPYVDAGAGSDFPLFFLLSPAKAHDALFARPLLAWAVRLSQIRPRFLRLDAASWGLRLITWIHVTLGTVAVIPWNPKRQKNRFCLPNSSLVQGGIGQTQWH